MSAKGIQAPRGTRDFYPDDFRRREWLFEHFREVARRFAFEEVDAPLVEHAELFTRKAGEEIVEQLYHFELHDRHLALRPEMTPSMARMVMARAGALRMPLRWFTVTQNWRYERMTRGRKREHYQWNMDIWGEPGPSAEAELISAIFHLLDAVGLDRSDAALRLNSRSLLEETLRAGVLRDRPEAFEPLCIVIDKLDKIGRDAVVQLLTDPDGSVQLPNPDANDVVDLLEVKSLEDAANAAPEGSEAVASLRALFEALDAYGVANQVVFDGSVVRGLAYYTGTVFEAFDTRGELRAICGGGRYDRLTASLGGKSIPAAGFGFGDVVIMELLSDRGLLPKLSRDVEDVVFAFGIEQRPAAIRVAERLRRQGRRVELVLGHPSAKRALADADRAGAARIWLLGPDEVENGRATVRDLETGEQHQEALSD